MGRVEDGSWAVKKRVAHDDAKVFGRYVAADTLASNDVIYFQDDDVLMPDHQGLLDAFNAREHLGDWIANRQPGLDEAQGYWDLALVGCGSLVPKGSWWDDAFARYLGAFEADAHANERFLLDADFIFGVLSHWHKVDLGLGVLEVASADNRLWRQPGQKEAKHTSINQARSLRTIVLTMLTKNEQDNVMRALSSARPLYDSVLIHDTGSEDHTADYVLSFCEAEGIPCRVERNVTWEGFGANRNRLIADAHAEADYMLLMDADEEFVEYSDDPSAVHRPELFCDTYVLHYAGSLDYAQPRILYCNYPFEFDSVKSHAALNDTSGRATHPPIACDMQEPKIKHYGDDVAASESRYARDVENLTQDIADGHDVPRSHFMRGKAYEGLAAATGNPIFWEHAIADYRKRVEMSTGDEESYYSQFRLGCLLVEKRNEFLNGTEELMKAWVARPRRIESLRALAEYVTVVADATPYPTGDMIIVHRDLYRSKPQ